MSFPNFALHNTPVNRVAGRVSFGESAAWEPRMKPRQNETFDAPPLQLKKRPKASPDYGGFRRGSMVAFRYHTGGNDGAQWLCRCDCGKYELRKTGKWVKKADLPDCCVICQATYYSTHGAQFNDTRTPKERQAGGPKPTPPAAPPAA